MLPRIDQATQLTDDANSAIQVIEELQSNAHLKHTIDKIPACCPTPDSLQEGDILVFSLNPNSPKGNAHPTSVFQAILNNSGGNATSIHVGYVVNVDGKKMLAHLRMHGFTLENVDTIKTTTHVYRPRIYQKEIANHLNELIRNENKNLERSLRWTRIVSLFSYVKRIFNGIGIKNTVDEHNSVSSPLITHQKSLSTHSICSKFLAESYVSSCTQLSQNDASGHNYRNDLMNIRVNTLPKTLQSYLYRCSNYEYLVLPNKTSQGNLVDELKAKVMKELARIKLKKDQKSQDKAAKLETYLSQFILQNLNNNAITNDFENMKVMLSQLLPILAINTGKNIVTPTSYSNVLKFAKNKGLDAAYFNNTMDYNYQSTDLTSTAKQVYGYDDNLAKLYSECRHKGYSDKEAKFECKPTFLSWLEINERRNIAAGISILPFLFLSVPIGLTRVHQAKNRIAGMRM